ncbi:BAG domain-containing protein Samui isoform X2 [Drosophila navojoa]|uniref:BAG domain-containing protein Samui isoform X2 n=1 Tax=Drosophila navojoa TaxID=7232 RepID=UPI000847B0E1|nr:BAG domain-containing protein Samui isoform X2 [Drosophila navojoa]
MKPTVIAANQASAGSAAGGNSGGSNGSDNGAPAGAGINIPISREYVGIGGEHSASPQQHYAQQRAPPQFYNSQSAYGSPRQQQVPPNQPQQHFQPFGFEPDMDMDMENMFGRSRLGRLNNDPFAGFGGTRKRNSLHDPHIPTHPQAHSMHADDDFSHYFDDAADFGFPQFSTLGRRGRAAGGANSSIEPDDDFFHRLPSEFRQYIPEGFTSRRAVPSQQRPQPPQQYYQQEFGAPQQPGSAASTGPQSPSKRLCDAAIQTDDPAGRSEVDCAPTVNLNQHGLRNTMDMGVKSTAEQEQGPRSHSAPPPEQQQLNQQYQQQTNQQRPTPPQQFGTQTSPPAQPNLGTGQPQFHKTYYAPQQQAHPQQKQQTPPRAQTPGGSNVRTIPIFVEGRAEPVINAHKEIPNQSDSSGAQAHSQAWSQAHHAPTQPNQQQRPAPLNTQQPQGDQQLQTDAGVGVPPQTPHTVDSIKKIQDIQRDVLDLMAKVEQFKGTRQDKEYVYLDEMLTRNLLKLDTIDTNGKDSIRLARKEAIKCIQASVNVLDAKAEENGRRTSGVEENTVSAEAAGSTVAKEEEPSANADPATPQPLDATKIQDPIPLPPPQSTAELAADQSTTESQAASTDSMATPQAEITVTQSSE